MGRRRLWIIVGTGLALVVGVLALNTFNEPGRFRFLEAHRALIVKEWPKGRRSETYSWKTGWIEVRNKARDEAAQLGFLVRGSEDHLTISGERPYRVAILIMADQRVLANGTVLRRQPGWVMVLVMYERPSLWDRIKAVFGL